MEKWIPTGKASKPEATTPWVQSGHSDDRLQVYLAFLGSYGDMRLVLDRDDAESIGRLLLSTAEYCLDPEDPIDADRLGRCPHCLAQR